ncbi:MAG: LuxR C-terminal-related transcriptional regulator [Leptolyngbyaceae cyanobacterium MO_188.B28]|nr:LuxR C-terminal-related transcriptional regulator [Leptolyngbyaceae cyanobacterium MO_188.B28]
MFAQSPPSLLPDHPSEPSSSPAKHSDDILAQAILASWFDGVLILSQQGRWVQANLAASQICDRLAPGSSEAQITPSPIWSVCLDLIHNPSQSPHHPLIAEAEIRLNENDFFRIRARWFNYSDSPLPHLLVILEDRGRSIYAQAISEVDLFNLSPREAEVWLLHRTHFSYKEIAAELFISVHTVKKHMKNIRNKQLLVNNSPKNNTC